jgi:anti-anti-sigma factor
VIDFALHHMGSTRALKVHRTEREGCEHLKLIGELDLGTAPMLEDRLRQARADQVSVRLDLSELRFMDSTGLHVLIRAVQDSRVDGWHLELDPNVSPPVRRLLQLVNVEAFLLREPSDPE